MCSGCFLTLLSLAFVFLPLFRIYFIYRWGLGPIAQRKKGLIKEGKLDKYGRKNDKTPADYLSLQGSVPVAGAATTAGSDGEVKKDKKKKDKKADDVRCVVLLGVMCSPSPFFLCFVPKQAVLCAYKFLFNFTFTHTYLPSQSPLLSL